MVMVKLPAGIAVEAFENVPEVHEAVEARLFTTTTWFPVVAPALAEAVTRFAFDEFTVREARGPVRSFRVCISASSIEAPDCSVVSALFWLWSVASCDCQAFSGACAAVTAAFTADVTSIPGEDDPKAACRIELMSMEDEPRSEFSDDIELI
jgi:hypothetical protein